MASLTAQQICNLARQAAKVPGYTTQSGQWLNAILDELCQDYDFQIARGTTRFDLDPSKVSQVGSTAAGSGPYSLPDDFLRWEGPDSVFYVISQTPYPLIPCDLSEFDMTVQQAGLQSFPYIIATDLSQQDYAAEGAAAPQSYIWPPPSGTFPVTGRYFRQMPVIVTPESSNAVPWFPNTTYLITRLAGELMKLSDDTRAGAFLDATPDHSSMSAADILARYLKNKDDKSNRATFVTLDRRQFGRRFDTLKNTKKIGW